MEYVYTAPNCPRCDELKKKLNTQGIVFEERDGERLSKPSTCPPEKPQDNIDIDAFVQLSIQNMVLPVQVAKGES